MKNTISEPPGRNLRRQSVISLSQTTVYQAPSVIEGDSARHAYRSVDDMVHEMRPEAPVYCLRPATIAATAKRFLKAFPGDVLYAVKCNPDSGVLRTLYRAGVTHFDVASLAEIQLVAELLPEAEL